MFCAKKKLKHESIVKIKACFLKIYNYSCDVAIEVLFFTNESCCTS